MPEFAPAAAASTSTATPAEPLTTTSIIESAIADLPGREDDSPHAMSDDTPPTAGASSGTGTSQSTAAGGPASVQPPASQQQQPPTQADVDELAAALGIKETGTGKWTSRVAYSKVHKAVKELREKLTADHATAIKGHTDRISTFEQQVAAFDQLVASPEKLLSTLAQVNPAYARFLSQPPDSNQPPQEIKTIEDLQRVIDHQVAQRLAPIEQERQQRQVVEQAIPRVKAQLAEAEKWPLFTESKAEILAELQKNPQAGLRDAYQTVVIPKLAAGRDKVRQDVLSELNARPHSSTVTSTVSGRTAPDTGPRDTQDIIRESIRKIRD